MPITCPLAIRNLTQPEFDECDAVVMRCAYASQNALGRLCDERVYENDLALRLRAEGFASVHTQVPVTVRHDDFEKVYRLDLVAGDMLYESKTVSTFVPPHDTQALHYAMLLNVNHVKLLNFRTVRVQGRLRINALLLPQRFGVSWDDKVWRELSPQCKALKQRMRDLMADWGAGLESRLYEEALVHFCGGEAKCRRRVPVLRDGVELGSHTIQGHADGLFFLVTTFADCLDAQCSDITRPLALTGQRAVQWINLDHTTVQFITIETGKDRLGKRRVRGE